MIEGKLKKFWMVLLIVAGLSIILSSFLPLLFVF